MNILEMEVVTCFKCESQKGYYLEFVRSGTNYEKILCPCCHSNSYTVPNSYMSKMRLTDLDNLFHIMGRVTGIQPLRDRHFKSLAMPGCIVFHRKAAV